jgi:uncharacterized protein YciI
MAWFIKRETFVWPREELRPHLQAHRQWVLSLQEQGHHLSSGYLVDDRDQPGGGGFLVLEAKDYADAHALVNTDPMVCSGGVAWELHRWVPVVGDLAVQDGD